MKTDYLSLRINSKAIKDKVGSPYTCERCKGGMCHPETCNCWCHS